MKETIVSCEESVSEVNEKLKAIKGLFVQEAKKTETVYHEGSWVTSSLFFISKAFSFK